MKFIIHYNGRYKDSLVIQGQTIDECRKIAYEEEFKRGWEEENCWSELLEGGAENE